ncbi:MAG: phosphatidylglycerophosphatase A [Bdellovibrionaceae bacterium]|nr:phosphatidylglycerophosphatase A [Pseudobdellovibrionaceae bacterium]
MRKFLIQLAPFFGVGRLPYGPGTWGTLAAVPLAAGLMWLGPFWHMTATLLLFPLSVLAAQFYCRDCGVHDAGEVVIDEVLGFLITMVMMPLTWQAFVMGFVLFRILDILKPFPISYLDRKVEGGFGVILDDVVAGLIANVILQVVLTKTNWLGVQYLVISAS